MKLDQARRLKAALLTVLEGAGGPLAPLALDHRGAPQALAAVGVSPREGAGEYGIAVRIFHGAQTAAPAIQAWLGTAAADADIATGVRYEPRHQVRAGASVGHRRVTAGTIGAFVRDADGRRYVLSNNHVLANCDRCELGDEILSPGPADGGPSAPVIARLARWMPLFAGSFDAAIAELEESVVVDSLVYGDLGPLVPELVEDRYEAHQVLKQGRTTGLTRGVVSAFELDAVALDFGQLGVPRIVTFNGSIEVIGAADPVREPFSAEGDSGSLVVCADTVRPYALLYGGGRDETGVDRTLCHFLPPVLESLGVELLG